MNLPLAAVLLLYIALPGIVVRRSYLSGPFSRSYLRLTLTDETVYSLGLALPFHGVGLLVSNLVFDRTLDLQGLAHLMTGEFGEDGSRLPPIVAGIKDDLPYLISYGIFIVVAAFAAGHGWRWVVRSNGWDRRYLFLRSASPWWYLLSGEITEFPEWGGCRRGRSGRVASARAHVGRKHQGPAAGGHLPPPAPAPSTLLMKRRRQARAPLTPGGTAGLPSP